MSSIAHRQGVMGTDYRTEEVLAASFLAASIPVWIFILIGISRLGVEAEMTAIEKGDVEQAVSVTPMIDFDSPLLKGGGKKVKLPAEWAAPPPRKKAAVASTNATDDPDAIPDPMPVYDGGAPPDPDAATTDNPDAEVNPETGEGGGEPGEEPGGEGEGGSAGSPDGGTKDKAKARAARIYASRLRRFFKAGFRCPKRPEGAPPCLAGATASISGDLTVTSVSFTGCGQPEVDSAAQAALNSRKGMQAPPPPEEYPELQRPVFGFTYTCK